MRICARALLWGEIPALEGMWGCATVLLRFQLFRYMSMHMYGIEWGRCLCVRVLTVWRVERRDM